MLDLDGDIHMRNEGRYTIISDPSGNIWINQTGNPSLAKGRSSDVLTGAILAYCLQHRSLQEGICNAVYIHGHIADQLIERGVSQMGVMASDIIDEWPYAFI